MNVGAAINGFQKIFETLWYKVKCWISLNISIMPCRPPEVHSGMGWNTRIPGSVTNRWEEEEKDERGVVWNTEKSEREKGKLGRGEMKGREWKWSEGHLKSERRESKLSFRYSYSVSLKATQCQVKIFWGQKNVVKKLSEVKTISSSKINYKKLLKKISKKILVKIMSL